MLKIGFIQAPGNDSRSYGIPLAFGYLISGLRQHWDQPFDYRITAEPYDLVEYEPDLIAISSVTSCFWQVPEFAALFREKLPETRMVIGGHHISALPHRLPQLESLEISGFSVPARGVGGDYYDCFRTRWGEVVSAIGDASGKGVPGAILMANLQGLVRGEAVRREPPEKIVQRINRRFSEMKKPDRYITFCLARIDPLTGALSYCNAGHHPPLVFSNGDVTQLTVGGTVVGLFENWNYEGAQISVAPGDILLYFTDGVVEAENEDDEQFGTDRLIELVQKNTFLTADDIQSLVLDSVFQWSAGMEQADDITVVCVRITDSES